MNNLTHENILDLLSKQNNSLDIKADNTSIDYSSIFGASQSFHLTPVIPISYAGNIEYDEFKLALNDLKNINFNEKNERINNYDKYISYALNNNNKDVFNYYNSIYSSYVSSSTNSVKDYIDNNFILKYEDIVVKAGDKYIQLDENTNINDFTNSIKKYNSENESINKNFLEPSQFTGAFLYPDIDTLQQIQIQDGDKSAMVIRPGESVSIPITFEFYISSDDTKQSSISKSLIFCIKDSQYQEPKYYEVEITGNNSINDTNSIYTTIDNFTLSDSLT